MVLGVMLAMVRSFMGGRWTSEGSMVRGRAERGSGGGVVMRRGLMAGRAVRNWVRNKQRFEGICRGKLLKQDRGKRRIAISQVRSRKTDTR